jgi:hypothetical protein
MQTTPELFSTTIESKRVPGCETALVFRGLAYGIPFAILLWLAIAVALT